jgi:hypothetical protein
MSNKQVNQIETTLNLFLGVPLLIAVVYTGAKLIKFLIETNFNF